MIYCKLLQQQIKHWLLKLAKPAAAKSVYLSDTNFFKRCSKSFNLSAGVRASLSMSVCVCVQVEECACFVGHVVFTIYAEKFALPVTEFPWMPNIYAACYCLLSVCLSHSFSICSSVCPSGLLLNLIRKAARQIKQSKLGAKSPLRSYANKIDCPTTQGGGLLY